MTLNINLFVHGVPMGQKIWGPKGDDQNYIASFYGPNWDAPEVMKIDIMTFGGITYCYYSFVKGQKVYDSQGRAGSYFALTLRINAFYSDIQNIYNVLKAAYEKMCVGLCVSETNDSAKYLLSDFQIIDSKLKEIENHILSYIREFSVSDDIINLSSVSINEQGASQNINLHECTRNIAIENLRRSGKLMVSPWFLSASAEEVVSQYKTKMLQTTEKARQEIQTQKQASQEKINAITKQYQDELRISKEQCQNQLTLEREENERKIATIKENYAGVDKKLDTLNRTIKDREKEVLDWQSQCRNKDKEIQSNNRQIEKLEHQISRLQEDFGEIQSGKGIPKPQKKKWILASVISFFIILLIGLLTWFIIHRFNGQKEMIGKLQETIEQLRAIPNDKSLCDTIKTEKTLSSDTTHISIVVKELTSEKDYIKVGEMCHVFLNNQDYMIEGGQWESNEFEIHGNTIMAKREYVGKSGKLSYKIEGKEIASIEIGIKE